MKPALKLMLLSQVQNSMWPAVGGFHAREHSADDSPGIFAKMISQPFSPRHSRVPGGVVRDAIGGV